MQVEVVGEEPLPVIVFHDAVSDKQIEMLKERMLQKGSVRDTTCVI